MSYPQTLARRLGGGRGNYATLPCPKHHGERCVLGIPCGHGTKAEGPPAAAERENIGGMTLMRNHLMGLSIFAVVLVAHSGPDSWGGLIFLMVVLS